jgi:hypothetical protein
MRDIQGRDGMNPIQCAIKSGNAESVAVLYTRRNSATDIFGHGFLHLASMGGCEEVVRFLTEVPDIRKTIIDRGGDEMSGWTPLNFALSYYNPSTFQHLLNSLPPEPYHKKEWNRLGYAESAWVCHTFAHAVRLNYLAGLTDLFAYVKGKHKADGVLMDVFATILEFRRSELLIHLLDMLEAAEWPSTGICSPSPGHPSGGAPSRSSSETSSCGASNGDDAVSEGGSGAERSVADEARQHLLYYLRFDETAALVWAIYSNRFQFPRECSDRCLISEGLDWQQINWNQKDGDGRTPFVWFAKSKATQIKEGRLLIVNLRERATRLKLLWANWSKE